MKNRVVFVTALAFVGSLVLGAGIARAQENDNASRRACQDLPSWEELKAALTTAQGQDNGFLGLQMWGTLVNRDGVVCAVAFTGNHRGDQWPGSRVISAQKANTGNEFSLPGLPLSTANLYTAVQPGGSLFGLQESNPVNTHVAYSGSPANYGQKNDGMVGGRIGGINVFGGGLALYDRHGDIIGGLGVSGDTSCADHNVAWRTRDLLHLDHVPPGVAAIFANDAGHPDNIIYDITPQPGQMPGVSASGWGHPACFPADVAATATLPETEAPE